MKDLRSEFHVTRPTDYESFPLTAPEEKVGPRKIELFAKMAEKTPEAKPKTAVWVVHGMGQQVPFATLEDVTDRITAVAGDANVENVQYREVRVDETVLQRVELKLKRKDGTSREVDIYECYWAPKTQGAVKLKNVIDFLWDGGSRGLINYFAGFQRALFERMATFHIKVSTPIFLLLTLAVLAALMVINAIILAVGAKYAGIGLLPSQSNPMTLTAVAALISAVSITFGVVLFLAETSKPAKPNSWWGHTIRNLTWISILGVTVPVILAGAVVMAIMFWTECVPQWVRMSGPCVQVLANRIVFASLFLAVCSRLARKWKISKTRRPGSDWFSRTLFVAAFGLHLIVIIGVVMLLCKPGAIANCEGGAAAGWVHRAWSRVLVFVLGRWLLHCIDGVFNSQGWIWPFLILISAVIRKLLVEYVGDVTAYVASNKVDSFDELRTKIRALAKGSLSAVYSAKAIDSDRFEYETICIVGHSLGSVIAYDTLNRLIADDELASRPNVPLKEKHARIADRTRLLLTFGSPLDKTAFFFSVIGKTTRHIHEQLASVVQPLIKDRDVRQAIEWVNVYSPNDIISGALDFYQFPEPLDQGMQQVRVVDNVEDEDAIVPLVAHVEYWANRRVWDELLARL